MQADSTDYLMGGSLTMKNGKVDKYLFGGGYAQASVASATTDNFAFYYYNQDHLGNIHEVVDASGAVKQVTNYYPFGAPYAESTAADFQPYKYNGKELDKMHGLNTYDYGARQHDPILARWDRIDPLCEKYYRVSPYVYCANNPVKLVDPDGKDPGDFFLSLDLAAKDFGKYTNPLSIQNNKEYATSFYTMRNEKGETGYSYTQPRMGGPAGVSSYKYISRDNKGKVTDSNKTTKEKAVATGHTHGAYDEKMGLGNDVFSGLTELRGKDDGNARKKVNDKTKDIGSSNAASLQDYLVTPNGTLQHYDPSTGIIRIVDTDMPKDKKDTKKLEDIKKFYGQK